MFAIEQPFTGRQFPEFNFPAQIQEIADRMNLDPTRIPPYTLPPLPFQEDCPAAEFANRIRPFLVSQCRDLMYGEIPPRCEELLFRQTAEGMAFNGLAIRREIDIICRHRNQELVIHLLLYIPKNHGKNKCPAFLGLNFKGNHATTHDPGVTFHPFNRYPDLELANLKDTRATEEQRGLQAGRFEFEKVLQAGYASATACYYELCPDRPSAVGDGMYRLFYTPGQWNSPLRPFGAISAWAWGMERAIDCLESQPEIDATRIILHGHSRLGKTALWTAANDLRIAMVISNGAGCCGAKLAHRYYGENFEWMNLWNSHWYRADFQRFSKHDLEYPIDQHFLLAALAPRPVLLADAFEDIYADPIGEFESCRAASMAWRLFGGKGLGNASFPSPGQLVGDEIGFYMREGPHDMTPDVWDAILTFAKQ